MDIKATKDTKDLLLTSAARLFRLHGYAAVSLRAIAAEAGVTTGSLYYYFTHKDQIVEEILDAGHRHVHQEVKRSIAALGPSADREQKVRAGIRAHLAALFEKDGFPAANVRIFAHVPSNVRSAVRQGRHAYEQYWINLLSNDEGGPRVDLNSRQLAMFLFGAANWTLEWHREGRDSLDDIAASLSALFLGLASVQANGVTSVAAKKTPANDRRPRRAGSASRTGK